MIPKTAADLDSIIAGANAAFPVIAPAGSAEVRWLQQPSRGVLLLGGDSSALGVARSLEPLGVKVRFLEGKNPLARYSRKLEQVSGWKGPEAEGAMSFLERLAVEGGLAGAVLIPAGDSEVRLVTEHHDSLSKLYRLTTPPWNVTRFCGDKQLTYALCAAQGLGHPRTYILEDLAAAASADIRFPVVIKPAMKEGVNALTTAKMWPAHDRNALLARFEEGLPLAGPGGLVVQEMIPDDGSNQFSFCAFCIEGEPRVVMAARRTRQRPRKAGTGTFVETLPPQPFEAEAAVFLRTLRYSGLVEIEYMLDPRDNRFKLIDVNPRIWTWHALGLPAGVNFAGAVWRHANGLDVPSQRAAAGCSWIYAMRDMAVAFAEIRDGQLGLGTWLRQIAGASTYAAFALDDPLPALADIPLSLRRHLSR